MIFCCYLVKNDDNLKMITWNFKGIIILILSIYLEEGGMGECKMGKKDVKNIMSKAQLKFTGSYKKRVVEN